MDKIRKNSILIVDDDDFNLDVLKEILKSEYIIHTAKRGREGIELAGSILPDLILLDIVMPDMDGFDVLKILKTNEKTQSIPVIIITVLENVSDEEKSFDLEAADYIQKPFSFKIVKLKVRNQMQIVNQMRELIKLHDELEAAVIDAKFANNAKSSFLARMSHEIRTPLNAVLGISEIHLQDENVKDEIKEAFLRIYNSGELLLNIINDILDISKIEAGKLELVLEQYQVSGMIYDAVFVNMIKYENNGVEFFVNVDENVPSVLYGDEIRIKQILNNLLSNAFKYTPAGEVELLVKAEKSQDDKVTVIFCVRDTGQGMTSDQLNKLFDEYTRFNMDKNRTTEGTGLGMGITQNLIRMMNGEIMAESEKGKGSVFTIRLPQGIVNDEVLGKETVEKLRQFRTNYKENIKRTYIKRVKIPSAKVLVVDDIDMNLYVTKGMLTPYGMQVNTALSGAEAIEKIKKSVRDGLLYDIIFMDHMMPVMDGIEAVKIIRDMGPEYKKMPIIALTANAVSGMKDKFLENGFNGFVSKPVNMQEMDSALNEWISPEKIIKNDQDSNSLNIESKAQVKYSEFFELIKKITGINTDSALTYSSGKIDVYYSSCRIFYNKIDSELNNLTDLLEKNDPKSFLISIHAMKSMLALIGNSSLSDNARDMENAALDKDMEFCRQRFDLFKENLIKFKKQLSGIFDKIVCIGNIKVLLVDDVEMHLVSAKNKIELYGLNVDTAKSGEEAIEKIKNNEYALVFMNYLMPVMNGIQATTRIREWEKENNVKRNIIIELIADEDLQSKETIDKNNFDGFISKPIADSELEEILGKWLPQTLS